MVSNKIMVIRNRVKKYLSEKGLSEELIKEVDDLFDQDIQVHEREMNGQVIKTTRVPEKGLNTLEQLFGACERRKDLVMYFVKEELKPDMEYRLITCKYTDQIWLLVSPKGTDTASVKREIIEQGLDWFYYHSTHGTVVRLFSSKLQRLDKALSRDKPRLYLQLFTDGRLSEAIILPAVSWVRREWVSLA